MTRGGFGPASAVGGGGGSSRCGLGTALREPQGDRNRESPLRRGAGESGMRWGLVAGLPRSAPLWIPASAGTTMGGIRADEFCWRRRGEFPLRRDGRFANRPYDGVWGVGDAMGVSGGAAPLSAPLDTGFRRYDDGGYSSRRVLLEAEGGVPAAAGRAIRESPLRRGVGSRGRDGGWWWGCRTRRTSGYRLPPVRRWGVFGPVGAAGGGG